MIRLALEVSIVSRYYCLLSLCHAKKQPYTNIAYNSHGKALYENLETHASEAQLNHLPVFTDGFTDGFADGSLHKSFCESENNA